MIEIKTVQALQSSFCKNSMEVSTERKEHRSGRCLRNEPKGLDVLLKNNEVERAFKQVGYWRFCEKL